MGNPSTLTRFTHERPGPGRPKGSKNKCLPAAIKLRLLQDFAGNFESVLRQMFTSRVKTDRRWAADQYRRMLPQDVDATVQTGESLCIVIPTPAPEPAADAGPHGG